MLWVCGFGFSNHNPHVPKHTNAVNRVTASADTLQFQNQIQPILQKNCSPCHFSGGKMYEKMPFDRGETIIQFNKAIVKRMKTEKEKNLLRQFINQYR
jgi:hypothetical protein